MNFVNLIFVQINIHELFWNRKIRKIRKIRKNYFIGKLVQIS